MPLARLVRREAISAFSHLNSRGPAGVTPGQGLPAPGQRPRRPRHRAGSRTICFPAPRRRKRTSMVCSSTARTNDTLVRFGKRGWRSKAAPRERQSRSKLSTNTAHCGLPTLTMVASAPRRDAQIPRRTRSPCSSQKRSGGRRDEAEDVSGFYAGENADILNVIRFQQEMPRRSGYHCQEISGRLPSEFQISMAMSADAGSETGGVETTSHPSAPTPV